MKSIINKFLKSKNKKLIKIFLIKNSIFFGTYYFSLLLFLINNNIT